MKFRSTHITICLILSCVIVSPCLAVVYVDLNAPGPGHDGASWDTAFLTVQEGVDAATLGGEVWVADGVYVENVVMGEGVQLYGGFLGAEPGGYEEELGQRDFVNNIATIDGNQSGSCVVMAPDARVDGFTITNGSGTPRGRRVCGGGIYCFNLGQTCAIVNNTITGHRSSDGAGIYCESSSPTITGNTITDNSVDYSGGGVCCLSSSPTITNNTIRGNWSDEEGYGGGIYCLESSGTISDNTITENTVRYGGGMLYYLSSLTVTNNIISGNSGSYGGGGIYCSDSSGSIASNTITDNSAPESWGGGGIYCFNQASPTITNNVISGNFGADSGGGIRCSGGSAPVIADNTISRNSTDWRGGGICCERSSPVITGNAINGNSAEGGGGMCCWDSSPGVDSNSITDNTAYRDGGGVLCDDSSPVLTNNIIAQNDAAASGGGVYCYRECSPLLTCNTICGNSAAHGGALGCDSWNQEAPNQVTMTNCVLWNGGDEVWNNDGSTIAIVYSDVWGGWPGEGNIDAEPMFVDPENGDYHLSPESPCIDAGWNDAPGLPEEDFEGDPRIIWAMKFPVPYWPHPGYVDIGADEYVPPGAIGRGWLGLGRLPGIELPTDRGQIGGAPAR